MKIALIALAAMVAAPAALAQADEGFQGFGGEQTPTPPAITPPTTSAPAQVQTPAKTRTAPTAVKSTPATASATGDTSLREELDALKKRVDEHIPDKTGILTEERMASWFTKFIWATVVCILAIASLIGTIFWFRRERERMAAENRRALALAEKIGASLVIKGVLTQTLDPNPKSS